MIAPILQATVFVRSPDAGRVLMIHRDKRPDDIHAGKYLSLGGHVEPDEDVLTCARREVLEESGLIVTDLNLRGTVMWTGFGPKRRDYFCFIFRADSFHGDLQEENEEGRVEWVPIAELPSLPMWDSDHLWLPMVFDQDPRPFYGVMPYDGDAMLSWSYQR